MTTKRIAVLVVDDSSFMRRAITDLIQRDPTFEVVGTARNGRDAVMKAAKLKPDLVTMDVEMPEMNGIQAVAELMRATAVPVVMISALTRDGAVATLEALEAGAVDAFLKEDVIRADGDPPADFYLRLKAAAMAHPKRIAGQKSQRRACKSSLKKADLHSGQCKSGIIVIGASTGGPAALQTMLPQLNEGLPVPIVVVQHMPVGFTKYLAERLAKKCRLPAKEAENGERLNPGVIYIAPAGRQTIVQSDGESGVRFRLFEGTPGEFLYNPSVDVTLSSVVGVYGARTMAVILTGMGKDGLRGCEVVKRHGGQVIVEAEESCVVYGMPRVVYESGYADVQVPLEAIAQHILQAV
ncbi:MAG: chemotaxis response regulator protein-glutamate methylesterase [Alicyclobacillus sp.]|nr:chemotaxis response regulator protein-glutamate methylesterase [Alicyclobacillus sp.]